MPGWVWYKTSWNPPFSLSDTKLWSFEDCFWICGSVGWPKWVIRPPLWSFVFIFAFKYDFFSSNFQLGSSWRFEKFVPIRNIDSFHVNLVPFITCKWSDRFQNNFRKKLSEIFVYIFRFSSNLFWITL